MTKTKKTPVVHPFDTIDAWSVVNKGVTLIINREVPLGLQDGISLDVEHDGNGKFVGIGIYSPPSNTCYYWSDLSLMRIALPFPRFIAHNGVSDLKCLKEWGFEVDESYILYDTMLMAHILDSSRRNYGLKNLAKLDLGVEWPSYESIVGKKRERSLLDFPVEAVAEYNSCDSYYTYKLYEFQNNSIGTQFERGGSYTSYCEQIESPCAPIFTTMSDRGIRIDLNYLRELKEHLEDQKQPIEGSIKNELGSINLSSPKQLLEALHAKDIHPILKNKPSTDKRALEKLRSLPVVEHLLAFSELDTLLSSFVYPYLERNVEIVRPKFNQVGTRTGRPSCSNPNLLQIPKRTDNGKLVRKMFIARNGYVLGDCDYGQIEPRLFAHLSKDKNMLEMFSKGVDFHAYTSERLGIDREKAKILNLSVGYRATFKSVSQQLRCSDSEAQKEIDEWWAMFPELRMWQDKLIWQSKKDGFFTTLMGRRIKVEGLGEYNKWQREHAQRQLINNIAQSSAAEVMKLGMVKVNHIPGVNLLVQVYDELLFEVKDTRDEWFDGVMLDVQQNLEGAIKLDIPLVVEMKTGPNWAEMSLI